MENETKKPFDYAREFFDSCERGQSFLFDANKEPHVIKNYSSKAALTGRNYLYIAQNMKDMGKIVNFVVSDTEKKNFKVEKNGEIYRQPLFNDKGTKSVGVVTFEFDEKYTADDPLVISGEKKEGDKVLDEKGFKKKDIRYTMFFAAEDLTKSKFVLDLDENGNKQVYAEDVLAKPNKEGKIETYKNDMHIGSPESGRDVKAGDPIIEHLKGSVKGHYESTGEHIVLKERCHFAPEPWMLSENISPLYKRKDDSIKEIFIERMSEAFRGKMTGNFPGMKPFNSVELKELRKQFEGKPYEFNKAVNRAWVWGEGKKDVIAKFEANYISHEESNSNSASNTEKKENINKNVNQNSHGRKR